MRRRVFPSLRRILTMPVTLIAALFLAFGFDSRSSPAAALLAWPELARRCAEVLGGVGVTALVAFGFGGWVSVQVRRFGYASSRVRRPYVWGTRILSVLLLAAYAATLDVLGWRLVVRTLLAGREWPLVTEFLVLLPFLLAEAAVWCGLFSAERALHISRAGPAAGLRRHLVLKTRQAVGLLMPVLLVYALGQDVAVKLFPSVAESSAAQAVGLVLMAALVLAGSPFFLRLAWPTYSLPAGPLRDRLEAVAQRVGFRCTDILVWDTGHSLVNAGVTGTLPGFRYVLLSDALIDNLTPEEIAAVFGHEVGHIAHRHLLSFGLFFLSTIGVMLVINGALDEWIAHRLAPLVASRYPHLGSVLEPGATLVPLAIYFFLVFGLVSRRFERQADLFGCRVVSCGRAQCPPHRDADAESCRADTVCPAGIRTFVSALTNVAALNGMARSRASWRHGSIARRVAFLESLEGRPDAEQQFQRGVFGLRIGLALLLVASWGWALAASRL